MDEPDSGSGERLEPEDPAIRLRAIVGRSAGGRLRRRFARALRQEDYGPADPAPWRAAHLGVADPRESIPRAFRQAERTLVRLRQLSPQRQRRSLSQARREVLNPALLDLLVAEARRHLCTDPAAAGTWLDLAQGVVPRLFGAGFPPALLTPVLLRLTAHRANALRVAGELPAAGGLFDQLRADPRRRNLGRPDIEAELLSLEASLRISLRQFAQVESLLDRAQTLYRRLGDRVGEAIALVKRGNSAGISHDCGLAIANNRRAAELLRPAEEPSLYAMTQRNIAVNLADAGRPAEAAALLAEHRDLFERHDDPADRLREKWIEARIARAEGRLDDAAPRLAAVQNGWLSFHRPYDAALAALDAADLQLARGNWREVRRQAQPLVAIFESRGVHREAMAALNLLQRAERKEHGPPPPRR